MSEQSTLPHHVEGQPILGLRVDVVGGPDTGKGCVAVDRALSIGSAPGNDLVLSDPTVSRYHLELERSRDRIVVKDCGSTNGVFAGPMQIERGTVPPGTVLQIGKSAIRVRDGETVTIELHSGEAFGRLRGRAPVMRQLMARIERAARSDVPVLLLGETGTGKEVIAHAIHEGSTRAREQFETVDCGTLLPALIASELFGHEKGAFTGADRQHVGAFERADGGTLFLDEIGELPMQLQAALLGVLERKRMRRVGGSAELAVNVRVIAATHRDLRNEVNKGTFRQDLYYRLAVLLLRVPALRERLEDLPLLAEHFLREAGWDGPLETLIPRSVMLQLESHHWPGNVRELRNMVEATVALGEAPSLIEAASMRPRDGEFSPELLAMTYKEARAHALEQFERAYVAKVLQRASGNATQAARMAAMDRSYLFDLMKRHRIRARSVDPE